MGFIYYGARGNHIPFVLILWHARQWNRTHLEVTNIHPGWVGNSKVGWLSKSLIFQFRTFRKVVNFHFHKITNSQRSDRRQDLLCGTEPFEVGSWKNWVTVSIAFLYCLAHKKQKKHHRPYLLASSSASFITDHHWSSLIITDHHWSSLNITVHHCSSHFSFT